MCIVPVVKPIHDMVEAEDSLISLRRVEPLDTDVDPGALPEPLQRHHHGAIIDTSQPD